MCYVISNPVITFLRQTSRDPEIWILCFHCVSSVFLSFFMIVTMSVVGFTGKLCHCHLQTFKTGKMTPLYFEAETKWPPFGRRRFQTHFLE